MFEIKRHEQLIRGLDENDILDWLVEKACRDKPTLVIHHVATNDYRSEVSNVLGAGSKEIRCGHCGQFVAEPNYDLACDELIAQAYFIFIEFDLSDLAIDWAMRLTEAKRRVSRIDDKRRCFEVWHCGKLIFDSREQVDDKL